jgi:hypothetical protein
MMATKPGKPAKRRKKLSGKAMGRVRPLKSLAEPAPPVPVPVPYPNINLS